MSKNKKTVGTLAASALEEIKGIVKKDLELFVGKYDEYGANGNPDVQKARENIKDMLSQTIAAKKLIDKFVLGIEMKGMTSATFINKSLSSTIYDATMDFINEIHKDLNIAVNDESLGHSSIAEARKENFGKFKTAIDSFIKEANPLVIRESGVGKG